MDALLKYHQFGGSPGLPLVSLVGLATIHHSVCSLSGRIGTSLPATFVRQAHRFRRFGRSSALLYMYSPFLLAMRGRAYYVPSRADRWPIMCPHWIVDRL